MFVVLLKVQFLFPTVRGLCLNCARFSLKNNKGKKVTILKEQELDTNVFNKKQKRVVVSPSLQLKKSVHRAHGNIMNGVQPMSLCVTQSHFSQIISLGKVTASDRLQPHFQQLFSSKTSWLNDTPFPSSLTSCHSNSLEEHSPGTAFKYQESCVFSLTQAHTLVLGKKKHTSWSQQKRVLGENDFKAASHLNIYIRITDRRTNTQACTHAILSTKSTQTDRQTGSGCDRCSFAFNPHQNSALMCTVSHTVRMPEVWLNKMASQGQSHSGDGMFFLYPLN